MVKIGVQQPPAALKPDKEKEKAAGGDGVAGAVLLPPGAVSGAGARGGGGRGVRVLWCCFEQAPAAVSGFSGGFGAWWAPRVQRSGEGMGQGSGALAPAAVPGHGSECPAHTGAAELIPSGGLACGNVISDWSYTGGFQILTSLKALGRHGEEARGGKQMVLEQDGKQGAEGTER